MCGKAKDDIGIGPCLAGWEDDGLPKLNLRLRCCADFEADLESFAFEAGRHGQHDIRKRGRRRHEHVGMGIGIERSASANRIAVSEQQICAEPDESEDGIGAVFQNSSVKVPRATWFQRAGPSGRSATPIAGASRFAAGKFFPMIDPASTAESSTLPPAASKLPVKA
jgi:hypothetical protein